MEESDPLLTNSPWTPLIPFWCDCSLSLSIFTPLSHPTSQTLVTNISPRGVWVKPFQLGKSPAISREMTAMSCKILNAELKFIVKIIIINKNTNTAITWYVCICFHNYYTIRSNGRCVNVYEHVWTREFMCQSVCRIEVWFEVEKVIIHEWGCSFISSAHTAL